MDTCTRDALWHVMAFLPCMDLAPCFLLNKSLHAAWISFVGQLSTLDMSYSREQDQYEVITLLRHASRASHVALKGCHLLITDAFFHKAIAVHLDKMEHLSHVSLSFCTKLSMVQLSSATLESLDVSGCDRLTTLRLKCPRLNALTCNWCRLLNVPELVATSDVSSLTQLFLTGWDPSLESANSHVGIMLRACPRLEFLNVSHVAFSNVGLHALFASSSLRSVVLSQPQANVWVDGTWTIAELNRCLRRRPDIDVMLL